MPDWVHRIFDREPWYWKVGGTLGAIVAVFTFLGCWWYAIASWGFLLGAAFGWIVAGIIAAIAGGLTMLLWLPAIALTTLVFLLALRGC